MTYHHVFLQLTSNLKRALTDLPGPQDLACQFYVLFYFFWPDPTEVRTGSKWCIDAGETERRRRNKEFREESLIIIVTASHTGAAQSHHQSAMAPGRLTGGSVPVLPSRCLSVFYIMVTRKFITPSFTRSRQTDSCHAVFVSARHHHSCQSGQTRPRSRLWDVLFCSPGRSPSCPRSGQRRAPATAGENSDKLWHYERNQSLMNDWCPAAESSHGGEKQCFWPET